MLEAVKFLVYVLVFLTLVQFMHLTEFIGRKLRGEISYKKMQQKINSLEARIKELEEKADD
ncbi:hypothetical protein [Clostridium oceanicum]|uniref:Uncharacterized protein n=1 Tax=Clostridium oceanicum TaxID=1543 RepID=A0ABP3URS3_9CLOT